MPRRIYKILRCKAYSGVYFGTTGKPSPLYSSFGEMHSPHIPAGNRNKPGNKICDNSNTLIEKITGRPKSKWPVRQEANQATSQARGQATHGPKERHRKHSYPQIITENKTAKGMIRANNRFLEKPPKLNK